MNKKLYEKQIKNGRYIKDFLIGSSENDDEKSVESLDLNEIIGSKQTKKIIKKYKCFSTKSLNAIMIKESNKDCLIGDQFIKDVNMDVQSNANYKKMSCQT